jgi:hypothetical protein
MFITVLTRAHHLAVSWARWPESTFHTHTNEEAVLWVSAELFVWLMEGPLKSSTFESPDLNEHLSFPKASQYFTVGRQSRRQLLRAPRPKQCRCDVRTPNVELWILFVPSPWKLVKSIEVSCYLWDYKMLYHCHLHDFGKTSTHLT